MKRVLATKDDIVVELIPKITCTMSGRQRVFFTIVCPGEKRERLRIYHNVKAASFGPGIWDIGLKYRR